MQGLKLKEKKIYGVIGRNLSFLDKHPPNNKEYDLFAFIIKTNRHSCKFWKYLQDVKIGARE